MNKNNLNFLNVFSWMKYNYVYRQVKIISCIMLVIGLFLIGLKFTLSRPIKLFIKIGEIGKALTILSLVIIICLYVYLVIRILLTKKNTNFKYLQSMHLTKQLHTCMEQPENGNSSSGYDMKVYNRTIVPKTFSIITDSEVICFYYQAKPFRLNNLNKRNKQAIEDYISLSYSGHRSAWQPLNCKKYKNYFVNVIKL